MANIDLNYLYELAHLITKAHEEVSVKGAVILSSLAHSYNRSSFRMTRDIDMNLRNGDAQIARSIVQKAVNLSTKSGTVKIVRSNATSCSLYVEGSNNLLLAQLDVQFKATPVSEIYTLPNGYIFRGQAIPLILADKISVVSSDKLPRRVKDLYDLYFLCNVYDTDYKTIQKALKLNGRTIGDFAKLKGYMSKDKTGVRHAYSKYEGIEDKPEFDSIIPSVLSFLTPFEQGYQGQAYWVSNERVWRYGN